MNWPPHRFDGKAEAPKVCVHCPLPEDSPWHVKLAEAEEAMRGPVVGPFHSGEVYAPAGWPWSDEEQYQPSDADLPWSFRCYPCPDCGGEYQGHHRPGCPREKPEDPMPRIDPALVAALHRADATGNVAELHPDNVWKPRMIGRVTDMRADGDRFVGTMHVADPEGLPKHVSASAGRVYTEWDMVRRSRAALFYGAIIGFCAGSAIAVFACWLVGGFGG